MPLGNGRVSKSGRNLDRNHGRGLLAPGAEVSPERHSLALDGLVDLLYAEGVRPGTGTTYATVTKYASTGTSGVDNYISMLSDPAKTTPSGANITDAPRRQTASGQRYGVVGLNSSAGANYGRRSDTDAVTAVNTGGVAMVGRDLTANTARGRFLGSDGSILWTFADIAAALDTQPLDLVIGCAASHLFAPFAGTFFAMSWVASVVLDVIPTDAQLQAYAISKDARRVWGANVIYYVTATGLVGLGSGPIPPTVGSSNTICVGPTSADLVAL